MIHFLLYTPAGSLLLVVVATAVVAVVVRWAVALGVAAVVFTLWRLFDALRDRSIAPPRARSPQSIGLPSQADLLSRPRRPADRIRP